MIIVSLLNCSNHTKPRLYHSCETGGAKEEDQSDAGLRAEPTLILTMSLSHSTQRKQNNKYDRGEG